MSDADANWGPWSGLASRAAERLNVGHCAGSPHRPAPITIPLQQVGPEQEWLVGGKAANLAVLQRAKLPVPAGFCVTTAAFSQFHEASPEAQCLFRKISQVPATRSSELQGLSAELRQCLTGVAIPSPVRDAILAAWRALGERRIYAVRSSATVEDAADHSFAGQFDSVLNVQSQDALLAAVKRCWLSVFSTRAIAYHAKASMPVAGTALAVVVQEMVAAETAGVLFTLDPVSGDTGRVVIEATNGLGDQLVSGKVEPERVILERDGSGIIGHGWASGACSLNRSLLRQLMKMARRAEGCFGRPLDIEWAATRGRVFLLQARPITSIPKPKSWEERQNWSNLNTGEVFPDVTTPMTWSVIQLLMARLFRSLFRLLGADADRAPAAGLVAGRVYFNANTGLAVVQPFRFLLGGLTHVAQAIGGGHATEHARGLSAIPASDLPDLGFRWPKYILSWPRILYDLITHSPRRGDAWIHRLKAQTEECARLNVASLSTAELVNSLTKSLRDGFEGWDLLYLATQGAVLPLFQKACRDWLDDPKLNRGYRLFAGLGGVPETEAALALWRLAALAHEDAATRTIVCSEHNWAQVSASLLGTEPGRRFLTAWSAFMSKHGHHCRGELELFNARWSETPDYILGLVRGYLGFIGQSNPLEHYRRVGEERQVLTEQCQRRLNPIRRWLFSFALKRGQKLAVNREVWKDAAVRQMFLIRRLLLELGQRLCQQGTLGEREDIFFLEISEVEPLVQGKGLDRIHELILSRREEYQGNLRLSPPPSVVGKFDPTTTGIVTCDPDTETIQGFGVSPGQATGTARVILHTEVREQVQAGEILVAPFTDPAWTPYFIPAAGVVMEQGGVLSHGSIVARELGLPAVTNAASATKIIRTGDQLQVDGNSGRVTILSRRP